MEFSTKTQSVDAMYSQKALINYQMNDKTKMEYDLLQDSFKPLQCLLLEAEGYE